MRCSAGKLRSRASSLAEVSVVRRWHRLVGRSLRRPALEIVATVFASELEAQGLVEQPDGASSYRLSARGESLRPVLEALYVQGVRLADEVGVRIVASAADDPR